ncbi:ABC transporter ATP-binding protein [Pseudonocardia sp. TMWB2A]|uniref:ABC transporter ATP-binding protein n=1 Tax=Pseudonocardia sp. TMWB2A TaxID=687430 RepID=UPI00307F557F
MFSLPRITVPAIGFAILWQVGEAAVPVVMGIAIDRALVTGDAEALVLWIGILVVLYLALTTAARLANRLNVYALQMLQHRLRATLSERILHPVDQATPAPDGGLVSTMTNDVTRLSNAGLLLTMPVARLAAIGFVAIALLVIYLPLGVIVLIGAPTVVWLMGMLGDRLSRDTRRYQDLLAGTVARATDLVSGYRVVKGVRAEAEVTRRYRQASQETLTGARRNAGLLGRAQSISGAVNATFVAVVTGAAGWFAVSGALTVGELITTVGLAQALLPQIQGIANSSIPNLANARASSARILDTLAGASVPAEAGLTGDGDGQRTSRPSPRTPARDVPPVEIRLPDRTIRVEPGELVGVRSDDRTAAELLSALLRPGADGDVEVRIDDIPTADLDLADYRARVVVAPHRTTLFSGTVGENLTTPTSTPELVAAAVHAAACTDFVATLDMPVGQNGNRLSGGQRQRVALARALATDAPVLVLHDPTTAIDSATEASIAARLRDLRDGRSTVLVASSSPLLACCDRVIDLRTATAVHVALSTDVARTQ